MKKLIAVLLTLTMVLALAACASSKKAPETTAAPAAEAPAVQSPAAETFTMAETEPAEEAPAVMTHEEYIAAELDSEVCVETYVQAHQSWWDNKITVYAQSEDGAYFLYNMACAEEDADKLVPGTKIRVTGYKGAWAGEVEIMDATFEIIEGSFVAEAADVTELLGTDEIVAHQNEFACMKGLTVVASNDDGAAFLYNWDGSGAAGNNNDLYFNVTDGTNTFTFTVESYLCGEGTDVYTAVTNLKVGDVIDLEGFLYWYEGLQMHVTAVSAAA